MATREPPPFEDQEYEENEQDNDDLFSSPPETKAPEQKAVMEEVDMNDSKDDDDKDDLFADANTEVPLNDSADKPAEVVPEEQKEDPTPEDEKKDDDEDDSDKAPATTEVSVTSASAAAPTTTKTTTTASASAGKSKEEKEEEEGGDKFSLEISVGNPHKKGDGMSSYMVYDVNTKTTIPAFQKSDFSVTRRFSDFLGLHDKLTEKHLMLGRIVPPAPEKSVIGMTKIKMSKEDQGSSEFVEKRRAALERYLNRTAAHPVLRMDPDFREFLELNGDLPKATNTSALSGAGVMRLFNKVGDAVGKITFKMDETDQWFEEKQQQVESLDTHLRKLHGSVEALVVHRKDLSQMTGSFAKSAAMLANAEEHTALSRAISQLAEIEEKIEQLHEDQADTDFYVFAELLKDYVTLIGAVKDVFNQRVKVYKAWKEAESMLNKKREAKVKLELAHKSDKIPQAQSEIEEWEGKVEKGQEDFEKISENIRKEVARFDKKRVRDFKITIINYLETLMNNQQQLIKYWETFLPEAKAIA
ncbi:sorting nexin-2 [Lingula anatina]|uniref:Sorting nexin-2 n=1 Tax=Lingula anatina TaxID=7574 RepID=A0A1S3K472_LINAN|nr:sorting nexin-2 [Lingula anatina]|eukprot:XP_013417433.1 sorting nexin-2 [Lingula anatina]